MNFLSAGHSGHHPRDEAGGARQGRGDHPQELRGRRSSAASSRRTSSHAEHGAAQADAVLRRRRAAPTSSSRRCSRTWRSSSAVFEKLDAVVKPGAILATNTSTLDVNRIAAFTGRPQDVVGMHFFSPANVMKLLEVVRGRRPPSDVLVTVMQVAKRINKTAVVSGVCDGFIGNRMLEQYLRQAMFLLEEGASPRQVDRALERFGMAMGPFRMSDLAGNDVGWYIRKRRYVEKPNVVVLADRRPAVRAGPLRPEDRGGLVSLRSRASATRIPDPAVDATDRRLSQGDRHRRRARSPTTRSSSAASSRWSTKARASWRKASRSARPISTSFI